MRGLRPIIKVAIAATSYEVLLDDSSMRGLRHPAETSQDKAGVGVLLDDSSMRGLRLRSKARRAAATAASFWTIPR